jgi:DNA-binding NarL/FixJ family response regulator
VLAGVFRYPDFMKSIRVLIVDDLPQVRRGLLDVLRLAAGRVRPPIEVVGEAQNGEEAVRQARALHPDVILMDLEMPVLDGYEATRRIKAGQPAPRVIILTIHAGEPEKQKALGSGADGFIMKGTSWETLLEIIRKTYDLGQMPKG